MQAPRGLRSLQQQGRQGHRKVPLLHFQRCWWGGRCQKALPWVPQARRRLVLVRQRPAQKSRMQALPARQRPVLWLVLLSQSRQMLVPARHYQARNPERRRVHRHHRQS